MSLRIRPATARDAAAIGRIHVETWQSTYAGLLPAMGVSPRFVASGPGG